MFAEKQTLTVALGYLATAVFLLRLLPQPYKLLRNGPGEGVSGLSCLNEVVAAIAWFGYGLREANPSIWVVSAASLVPGLLTCYLARSLTKRTDVAFAAAWLGVLGSALCSEVGAPILSTTVLVSSWPQVRTALSASELSGVSVRTWQIAVLDAGLWGAYGVALGSVPLVGYAVCLTGCAWIILWQLRRNSAGSRYGLPEPGFVERAL